MLVRKDFGSANTGNEGFKLRLSYDMICPLMASDTFTCESMFFSVTDACCVQGEVMTSERIMICHSG